MDTQPKILTFDLESAGVNALKSDLGFVICIAYKWLHESKAHVLTIDQASLKRFDDNKLLTEFSLLYNEADLVVGHYASVFDRRFIQGRLLINNLPPIPPTKMRDTCFIARSVANFSSNRLKHLAKILNLKKQKMENGWPQNWFLVMQGDMKALKVLARYCVGDVLATEELYQRLLPFDQAHPRVHADRAKCGSCGGEVQYRGVAFVLGRRYRRFQCKGCGRWGRETSAVKEQI
jgi:hypothetical protein